MNNFDSIINYNDMYSFFNDVLTTAPNASDPLHIDFRLFNYSKTEMGNIIFNTRQAISWFYNWLYQWNIYLDSYNSTSVLPLWYDAVNISQYIIPQNGFQSWNEFFTRQIKLNLRPISDKNNSNIITSPVDGKVDIVAFNTSNINTIMIKGINYNLTRLFAGDLDKAKYYSNGTMIMISLNTTDYHHYHSHTDGIIDEIRQVGGLYYYWPYTYNDSVNSEALGENIIWDEYSARGFVYIKSKYSNSNSYSSSTDYYYSCLMVVGTGSCSSINFDVDTNLIIEKGQHLGNFAWGGSTTLLIYPKGVVKSVLVKGEQPVKMGQAIAIVH